jgi:LAO/AO transport system kinase
MARLFRSAEFDFVVIETVGVGQDEIEVADLADVTVLVLAPGLGDDVQAIKAGIMEIADIFVINKADRPGAAQTRREVQAEAKSAPVFQTVATEGAGVAELVDDLERRVRRAAREATEGRPNRSPWRIDHLGIAARSVDDALAFYSRLSVPVLHRETVEREKVRVAMLPAGAEARIELLEPLDETSAIAKFLEKRGPGIHHIAMKVPDLAAAARSLAAAGVKLVGTPQRGAGGHLYVFVHPSSTGGVLWELIQE